MAMTVSRSFRKNSFLLILGLSVALRLASAVYQGDAARVLPGVHDQISYHTLAARVLDGHGFSFGTGWWPATPADSPTAHWSYLYTLYLVAVYFVFGIHPLAARIIQAGIAGILHPWLCRRIGRRLLGERAGLIAALFAAVYGYFIYYAGALMTESFFILAVLWVMDCATELVSGASRRRWILLGVALGSAVLLRQVFLLFIPFLFAWLGYALKRERRPGLVSGIAAACLMVFLMIVPWTVRNYFAFRQFVLLNTNSGFAFFWGNHPMYGTEFIPVLGDSGSYGKLIPGELRNLSEAALDRELLRRGVSFVTEDPGRYLSLSMSRAKEYFKFWPARDSGLASNLGRLLSFGLFLPLMALGIVTVSASIARRKIQDRGHLLLLLFAGVYTLIHLLTWTLIRYRLPVDAVLILYAAAGAVWIADYWERRRSAGNDAGTAVLPVPAKN